MRVVVLGAGTVGSSIASLLCLHRHSTTVVECDPRKVRQLNESLDVRAILGSASQSSVLFQAGIGTADLCLAVTGDDEANLVAASMAKAMGAKRVLARVYAPVFRDLSTFDYQRHFAIDRLLSLEHLTAMELARRIRHPGSVVVESLAGGNLEVHEIIVSKNKVIGTALKELDLPRGVRLGSITRDGRTWIAGAQDALTADDRVTIIGNQADLEVVKPRFTGQAMSKQGVVIAGGGETGYHLAAALEGERFAVVLMEKDRDRCDYLASHLKHTVVVHRDATRRVNLEEERVGSADVFVACMGDDENNILSSVEALDIGNSTKRNSDGGGPVVMALVGRPDYAQVVGKLGISYAVSPREVVAKQVLGYLNEGAILSRTTLGEETGLNVLELDVGRESAATEHVLAQLNLPPQCLIAAVIREGFAKVPGADDRLRVNDTVVALVADSSISALAGLF
jgi:trk system potassium uptake protein TrkA